MLARGREVMLNESARMSSLPLQSMNDIKKFFEQLVLVITS